VADGPSARGNTSAADDERPLGQRGQDKPEREDAQPDAKDGKALRSSDQGGSQTVVWGLGARAQAEPPFRVARRSFRRACQR
jgi:hypothetical protein